MRNATRRIRIVAAGSTSRFMVLGETYCVLGNVIAHALLLTTHVWNYDVCLVTPRPPTHIIRRKTVLSSRRWVSQAMAPQRPCTRWTVINSLCGKDSALVWRSVKSCMWSYDDGVVSVCGFQYSRCVPGLSRSQQVSVAVTEGFWLWYDIQLPTHAADTIEFVIADRRQPNASIFQGCEGQDLEIGCAYDRTLFHSGTITLTAENPPERLRLVEDSSWNDNLRYGARTYTVPASDATGTRVYKCSAVEGIAVVTIHFGTWKCCQTSSCLFDLHIAHVCWPVLHMYPVENERWVLCSM